MNAGRKLVGIYWFNDMRVESGSGYDSYLRAWPWESDFQAGRAARDPMFWPLEARFLNGLPTYEKDGSQ